MDLESSIVKELIRLKDAKLMKSPNCLKQIKGFGIFSSGSCPGYLMDSEG